MASTGDKVRAAVIAAVLVVNGVWAMPLVPPLAAAVRAPLRPLIRVLGVNQSWAMFAQPDTYPRRLEVHVREQGAWRPVYERWDRDARLQPILRQRRVRGLYDAVQDETSVAYWNFTRWLAREVLLAHPDADAVRVQMIETHTTLPGEPVDKGVSTHLVREHRRSAVLPEDDLW